jgi:hypothetical protein
MTTTPPRPQTQTQTQTPPAGPSSAAPDPEAARITTIDELATEQNRQAGVLDELLAIVKGEGAQAQGVQADAHTAARGRVDARLDRPSMVQDQMRQAVRDVQAEAARQQAEAAHNAEHDRLKQPPPAETAPREVVVRGKARLQRFMFGADPG